MGFDRLGVVLSAKYAGIGNCTELCEPIDDFLRQGIALMTNENAQAADTNERAAQIIEDREIVAAQTREYEESLQRDELRAIEEMEEREAAKLADRVNAEELERK